MPGLLKKTTSLVFLALCEHVHNSKLDMKLLNPPTYIIDQ